MINFLDLKRINEQYADELKQAASEVIDSGWYIKGEKVQLLENHLVEYLGAKHVIGVANGLDALRLILGAYIELGLFKEGDEIIVPANTYIATILAITDNRLMPVLVEPDINTYNLDISLIEKHISSKTRAIMVVHLYGQVCWSEELTQLAEKYNLKLIEDNAQAIGAEWNGVKTGALGNAAGLSFYPGKNLGALGDGGAVATNDEKLAEVVRALGNYGSKTKYIHDFQGFNSRLDEIQATFLDIKLKYLDQENQQRREISQFYCDHITNKNIVLPTIQNLTFNIKNYLGHVWHLFVIRTKQREYLQKYLSDHHIQTLIHYPIPPHKQLAYSEWNDLRFTITEHIHSEILSLPISSIMKKEDIMFIINVINNIELSI